VPTEIIEVAQVFGAPTRKPGCTLFVVTGHTLGLPSTTVQYGTLNRWKASLCERAKETGQPVQVTWKDGRVGRDLVEVELAQ
jgi:hypothetical protein